MVWTDTARRQTLRHLEVERRCLPRVIERVDPHRGELRILVEVTVTDDYCTEQEARCDRPLDQLECIPIAGADDRNAVVV